MDTLTPTQWALLITGISLSASAIGAGAAIATYSLLLRRITLWPHTITKLIEAAPSILEGLSRLGIGVTELTTVLHRFGAFKSPKKE